MINNISKKLKGKFQWPQPGNLRKTWEENLGEELSFWEEWIKTQGNSNGTNHDYKNKLDPNSKLQDFILKYIDTTLEKNNILDVGAGPLTQVNKKCESTELDIHAIDPLADEYNKILDKHGINPIIKTEKLKGENLTRKYRHNAFDIVCSFNALDHTYDPLRVLSEMIKVTKEGGHIIFMSFLNEGSKNAWHGLHHWDFISENNKLFIKDKDSQPYEILKHFEYDVVLKEIITDTVVFIAIFQKTTPSNM